MWKKIAIDRLEVGQYVKLDYPWFAHPFPRSTFRLTSQDEIDLIVAHQLKKVFHDPAKRLRHDAEDSGSSRSGPVMAVSPPACPAAGGSEPEPAPETGAETATEIKAAPTPGVEDTQVARKKVLQDWSFSQAQGVQEKSAEQLTDAVALTPLIEQLANGDAAALPLVTGIADKLLQQAAVPDARPIFTGAAFSAVRAPAEEIARSTAMVLAALVSQKLQLDAETQQHVMLAAALRLIGASRFSAGERAELSGRPPGLHNPYRLYPLLSATLARRIKGFPPAAAEMIQQHRELHDDGGFPAGLSGEAIRPGALLVGLIHEFQLLTAPRRPSGPLSPAAALARLYRRRRAAFGPTLMDSFIAAVTIYPPGTVVELSGGEHAVVINCNIHNRLAPIVMVVEAHSRLEDMEVIDLATTADIKIARALGPDEISPLIRSTVLAGGKHGLAIDTTPVAA